MDLPIEMYRNYILRRDDDLKELSMAIATTDLAPFRKVGHQLKGNATSFGFDELLLLAERMHALSVENISKDGPAIVNELQTWITSKKEKFGIN